MMVDTDAGEPRPDGQPQRRLEKQPAIKRVKCCDLVGGFGTVSGWVWLPAADQWFSPEQKRVVEAAVEE